uniref:non-specific serine/threonine protein kinase n=1 Tax=Oryza glumipatula TaxID=40148 RepID=A0A0D9YPA2_9ORYZ
MQFAHSSYVTVTPMELADKRLLLAAVWPLAWLAAAAAAAAAAADVDDGLALTVFMARMPTGSGSPPPPTWGNRSVPVCRWRGVACGARGRRRGRVVALELPGLGLRGTVPPELGNLTYLRRLHLAGNRLHGVLPPELGGLAELSHLNLSGNAFQGQIPASLANCTGLEILALYNNRFHGEIPPELCSLRGLRVLSLGMNTLTGSIPSEIGNLANLMTLNLQFSNLTGGIPEEIGDLAGLVGLGLGSNQLAGSIPASLGNLSALKYLSIPSAKLTGSIPSLQNLSSLIVLELGENNLEGTVPAWLGNLSSLVFVSLQQNQLSGHIPESLGRLQMLTSLDLSQNNLISGTIPDSLGNLGALSSLRLDYNKLEGSFPPSLLNLSSLDDLGLQSNHLSGALPPDIGNKLPNLQRFVVDINQFHGTIPPSLCNATMLQVLQTVYNFLSGRIPQCLGIQQKSLSVVALSKNQLEATNDADWVFISSLANCSNLNALDLGYNKLQGAGGFGSVYKGRMTNNDQQVVAVKVLNLTQRGASQSFMAECETLRCVRHRNLVKILTVCSSIDFQGKEFKAIVYEYLPNGNLDQWLHPNIMGQSEHKALNLTARLRIAIDVASSLEYLHQYKPSPIIHCDLKPSNVLLDSDMVAHVSDFGLARFLHQESEKSSGWASMRGTVGYAAPEYGIGNEVSIQGDVYSYGILLLEMFTRKRPTDSEFGEAVGLRKYVQMALPDNAANVMDQQLLPETEDGDAIKLNSYNGKDLRIACVTSVMRIGISCSEEAPTDRVQIGDALKELQAIRDKFEKHVSNEGTSSQ